VPEACRDGNWYLYAALLLDSPSEPAFEANGVLLRTRDEALAAAIARPPELAVLVEVAFVAALGGTTKLPGDACAFAEGEVARVDAAARQDVGDLANYVCGHAALTAGDPTLAPGGDRIIGALRRSRAPHGRGGARRR